MSEAKVYPRIWDLDGERKIIGETRLSWLVENISYGHNPPIKVSKKSPNKGYEGQSPQWFFDEAEYAEITFRHRHKDRIKRCFFGAYLTNDQLRQVAAMIGYDVTP